MHSLYDTWESGLSHCTLIAERLRGMLACTAKLSDWVHDCTSLQSSAGSGPAAPQPADVWELGQGGCLISRAHVRPERMSPCSFQFLKQAQLSMPHGVQEAYPTPIRFLRWPCSGAACCSAASWRRCACEELA